MSDASVAEETMALAAGFPQHNREDWQRLVAAVLNKGRADDALLDGPAAEQALRRDLEGASPSTRSTCATTAPSASPARCRSPGALAARPGRPVGRPPAPRRPGCRPLGPRCSTTSSTGSPPCGCTSGTTASPRTSCPRSSPTSGSTSPRSSCPRHGPRAPRSRCSTSSVTGRRSGGTSVSTRSPPPSASARPRT